MYPLKFEKIFKTKVWGGKKFNTVLDIELPTDDLYGETWEVSCRNDGMSIVTNGEFSGKTIGELVDIYQEKLIGKNVFEQFQKNFPLLIKYLDINDRLSVQVHPSDEYALKVENEFGKSECWYIMEASDDATLILGVKDGITKEIFKEKVENKDFSDIFNTVKVKKGDFINLSPGVIHATLQGSILICEIQQNSDTTYRIYDFDRVVDGKLRELHIDKALDVIDFKGNANVISEENRTKIKLQGATREDLVSNKYFTVERLLIEDNYQDSINENFKVYSILDGNGEMISQGTTYPIKKGETYFIPANIDIAFNGKIELLKSYL